MTVSLETVVRRVPDHLHAVVHGETVIFQIAEGAYYGLNGTGTRVLQHLEQTLPVESLVRRVVAEFDVSWQDAAADVLTLVEELIQRGIVEVVGEGS